MWIAVSRCSLSYSSQTMFVSDLLLPLLIHAASPLSRLYFSPLFSLPLYFNPVLVPDIFFFFFYSSPPHSPLFPSSVTYLLSPRRRRCSASTTRQVSLLHAAAPSLLPFLQLVSTGMMHSHKIQKYNTYTHILLPTKTLTYIFLCVALGDVPDQKQTSQEQHQTPTSQTVSEASPTRPLTTDF